MSHLSYGRNYIELSVGSWYFTIYFRFRAWGFDFHRRQPCCKFWLIIGPFEINDMWDDDDDYPFEETPYA